MMMLYLVNGIKCEYLEVKVRKERFFHYLNNLGHVYLQTVEIWNNIDQ